MNKKGIELYEKGLFSVEDELFYENGKRLGYFEDENEEDVKKNNHRATVDRLDDLRELNIGLKRSNNQFRKDNRILKEKFIELSKRHEELEKEYTELKKSIKQVFELLDYFKEEVE